MQKVLLFLCLLSLHIGLHADVSPPPKKVLILIIASDGLPAYIEMQKIWQSYMHNDPDHVEVYFVKGDPQLSKEFEITKDTITVKCEESYKPGIINKTLLAMEVMLPRLKEFSYVVRTNLSSFYHFPNLLNQLESLPKEKCYYGIFMYEPESWHPQLGTINFISGAGIILSADLMKFLVRCKQQIQFMSSELADDVVIGLILQRSFISYIPGERFDFVSREDYENKKDAIPSNAFHFRAKAFFDARKPEHDYKDELYILQQLVNKYYPEIQK